MNATKETYLSLEEVYFEMNRRLFDDSLPACLITLQRSKAAYGYFHAEIFEGKNGNSGKTADEIALNPDHFGRDDKTVMSTIVHEMAHVWQHHFGRAQARNGYHCREWAGKMESIGLMPSTTGAPGGKMTGQKMSHYILRGGKFDLAADVLLSTGRVVHWASRIAPPAQPKSKAGKRTKYTCPLCGLNAWAKPGAALTCQTCNAVMLSD